MRAADAAARAIRDHGPIGFDEYMELTLYGEDGYYHDPPVGPHGDFVTSPHVHPVFAELLARGLADLHARLGQPVPFRIAEVGAGDGTLAGAMLPHLAPLHPAYTAVERSRGALA
ncbi:MAG TPA: SAM-dependent methyltransferase, partial [Actinomycetota bacterium]|nr:SAM-dependent methyltransferase [Actinomycetota bacterium]